MSENNNDDPNLLRDVKRYLQESNKPADPEKEGALRELKQIFAENDFPLLKKVMESFGPKPEKPILSPKDQWMNQAFRLAPVFAEKLRMTTREYVATLPKPESLPKNFREFGNLTIVETRFSLKDMFKILRMPAHIGLFQKIMDSENGGFETPKKPYIIWTDDGLKCLGKSAEDIRHSLTPDRRAATIYEGLSIYVKNGSILDDQSFIYPGSQIGIDNIPCLIKENNGPRIYPMGVKESDPKCSAFLVQKN
jgi:hypothetical protein